MLCKILLIYVCLYYSVPGAILADDMFVYIKLDDNTNYDIHRCGSIVRVKEKQKIEFYIPNNIQYVSCHNPLANMVMNVSTATLAVTRSVTTHVTDMIEGQWKCSILYTQDKSTQIYLMNGFSLNFDVEYAQEVVIFKDSQRYVINDKCCVHLFYYKDKDDLAIECSLPGVKTAQLKTGNLKWRFCHHEEDDEDKLSCDSLDPVTTRSTNFTGLIEYKDNSSTTECIYTSKYGVESIIKILFVIVPLKPPILTINGRQYPKALETSVNTYIGYVGELLAIACNSTEEGRHILLATELEDSTNSNFKINNNESIEYLPGRIFLPGLRNLTAEDNGTSLLCTYSGSEDLGASVAVNLKVYLPIDNEEGTDVEPPILTINGRQYPKALETSVNTYIGYVGELLAIACNSTEEGRHILLLTELEDSTYSNFKINNNESIEYLRNLTAEDNGTSLLCTYSGSEDLGASVAVNLKVYLPIDNEEGTDVVSSKAGLIIGLSIAIIFSVVAVVLCSLVKKKKTFRRPPLTTDPVQRPAAPQPETEHIYYTIDFNDYYSYTDSNRC